MTETVIKEKAVAVPSETERLELTPTQQGGVVAALGREWMLICGLGLILLALLLFILGYLSGRRSDS